jgi:ElaB/YqjD/DUF883 family membrane-anchored ribosome-binding protein
MKSYAYPSTADANATLGSELSRTAQAAGELGKAAGRYAGQTVRENPWRAAGILAGLGLLMGLALRRR